jgi:hypothetical protein
MMAPFHDGMFHLDGGAFRCDVLGPLDHGMAPFNETSHPLETWGTLM